METYASRKLYHQEYYKRLKEKHGPKYNMHNNARSRATKFGLEFDLTLDDVVIPERCPVLNTKLETVPGTVCPTSPSIDRVDNSRGYTRDNVAVLSMRANKLKSDATLDELIALGRWAQGMKDQAGG